MKKLKIPLVALLLAISQWAIGQGGINCPDAIPQTVQAPSLAVFDTLTFPNTSSELWLEFQAPSDGKGVTINYRKKQGTGGTDVIAIEVYQQVGSCTNLQLVASKSLAIDSTVFVELDSTLANTFYSVKLIKDGSDIRNNDIIGFVAKSLTFGLCWTNQTSGASGYCLADNNNYVSIDPTGLYGTYLDCILDVCVGDVMCYSGFSYDTQNINVNCSDLSFQNDTWWYVEGSDEFLALPSGQAYINNPTISNQYCVTYNQEGVFAVSYENQNLGSSLPSSVTYFIGAVMVHDIGPSIISLDVPSSICYGQEALNFCLELPDATDDPFDVNFLLPVLSLTIDGVVVPFSNSPSGTSPQWGGVGMHNTSSGNYDICMELELSNYPSYLSTLTSGVHTYSITSTPQSGCQTTTTLTGVFTVVDPFDWEVTIPNCGLNVNIENIGCFQFGGEANLPYCFEMGDGSPQICQPLPFDFINYTYSQPGTYEVIITTPDGQEETIFVTVIGQIPSPEITSTDTVKCCTNGAVYSVPNNYVSYTWDIGAFGTITSGQGTNSISVQWNAQAPGSFVYVTVVDANGCEAISQFWVEECCKYDNPAGATNIFETDYCGAMLLSDFRDSIQASGLLTGTISSASISTTDVLMINNELIADITFSFVNCPNIIFAPGAKITMVNNIKLSFVSTGSQPLIKTFLKAKCDQPWDGIYNQYPNSVLEFTRANARDANNLIVSIDGGKYEVLNSVFENNRIAIHAKKVNVTTVNHGGFIFNSTIQTNPNITNLFPNRGKYGILIENIDNIQIGSNSATVSGQFNTFKNLDFGIYCTNSKVKIYRNTFIDIDNTTASNINDYFLKGIGIYSGNGGLNAPLSVNLIVGDGTLGNANYFNNCATGVFANRRVNTSIQYNIMQGIDIAGIVVRNSVSMNHQIRNNNVSLNKGFIAIYLWNIPGSTARVEFNNINNQGTPFTKGTAGIAADAIGATFNTDLEINNNNVQHSDYGVLVYTVPNAKIRNNTITRNITNSTAENYGQNIYGINVAYSTGAIIENNLVNRMATNSFPTAANPNLNLIGIHAENSPDVQIFENTVNRWGKGIQAKDVNSNSDMYCNTFSKNYHGFFLVNAETGDQGVNLTGTTNDRVQDNKFTLGANANVSSNRISGSSAVLTTWYYRNPAPMYNVSNSVNNNAFQTVSIGLPMSTTSNCENGPIGPGSKSLLRQQKFEAIVNETKNFTSMQLYARYMDHLYAMREFDRDSAWLVTGDVSDSIYLLYFNTRYQGNDGKICSMAADWEQGNYTALATKTAALNTSCFYTQNIKTVNEIFLATWANDVYELDAVQQQTVLDLACSEAHDNGPGVYAARALIGFFAACDNGFIKSTTEMQGDVAEIEQSENGVSIYPNPSAGLFSVANDLVETETAELRVMDIAGKVVYMQRMAQQENSTQLDLQHLSNGIYLYQMVTDKGVVATGRLVINR